MTWLLVALVVAPGVAGPTGVLADPRPEPAAGRDDRDPLAENSDPLEESESEPIEDGAEEGSLREFLHASPIILCRLSPRERPAPGGSHAGRHERGPRRGPRDPERSSLAGSGRMIRRWLQSHVC